MRLHPSVPGLKRDSIAHYQVPGSNYSIPANSTVMIMVESIHRDERFYKNPLKFDPTHFDEPEISQRHAMAFMPFGDGPRVCIGMRFAQMQITLGLAVLLNSFRFGVARSTPIPMVYDPTVLLRIPKENVDLHVETL